MRDALLQKLPRLLLAFLLALGISFSFLGALNLEMSLLSCAGVCLLCCAVPELLGLSRRTALYGSLGLAGLFLLWLLGGPGLAGLSDVLRALTLYASGVPGALPLVAAEASLALTVVISLLCFLSSRGSAGGVGALLLSGASLLLLWLANRPDLTPRLLPALISALALTLMDRHEEVSPVRVVPWAAAVVLLIQPAQIPDADRSPVRVDPLGQQIDTVIGAVQIKIHKAAFRRIFHSHGRGQLIGCPAAQHGIIHGIGNQGPFAGRRHAQQARRFLQVQAVGFFVHIPAGMAPAVDPAAAPALDRAVRCPHCIDRRFGIGPVRVNPLHPSAPGLYINRRGTGSLQKQDLSLFKDDSLFLQGYPVCMAGSIRRQGIPAALQKASNCRPSVQEYLAEVA